MLVRLILHLIPLLIFGIFAYLWHQEVTLGKESVSWPTTNATLTEASLGGKRNRISYSYSVNETSYKGHKLEFCSVADKDQKEYFARNLKGKTEIIISYCPSDPTKSVVRPGIDERQFTGYFILGGFALVVAIAIERFYRRYFNKAEQGAAPNPCPTGRFDGV